MAESVVVRAYQGQLSGIVSDKIDYKCPHVRKQSTFGFPLGILTSLLEHEGKSVLLCGGCVRKCKAGAQIEFKEARAAKAGK